MITLAAIKLLFKSWKLWAVLGCAVALGLGTLYYGHKKYQEGKNDCILAQAQAQASYWEQKGEQLAIEGKQALVVEKSTSENINRRINNSKIAVEKSSELDKNNPNGSCLFSPDELPGVNAAIREANS